MALGSVLRRYTIFTALVLFLIGTPAWGETAETAVRPDLSQSFDSLDDCDNDFRSAMNLRCLKQHDELDMESGTADALQGDGEEEEEEIIRYGFQKVLHEGLTARTLWDSLWPYLKLSATAFVCVFLPMLLLGSWVVESTATSASSKKKKS